MTRFIDRKGELAALQKELGRKGAGLIVVFGRRRTGKTRLVTEFLQGRDSVYYLAADQPDGAQVSDLKGILADYLKDPVLRGLDIRDWKSLFGYLEKAWPRDRPAIIAIDEVTYITKNNPSFPSLLQRFWDGFLSRTQSKLILCGSLVGLMMKDILSSGSPLYGRRTLDLQIQPFPFRHAQEFMDGVGFEDRIRYHAVLGGIPKYLEQVEGDFDDFLLEKMLDPKGFFYREGIYLLSEEFRDSSTYSNILRGIAAGDARAAEIGARTGMDTRSLSAYIHILEGLGFVARVVPFGRENGRGALYRMSDNFLEFWFRFIQPNRSAVELGRGKELCIAIRNDINSFVGRRFEDVCREYLADSGWGGTGGIGRWWKALKDEKKVVEIDLFAPGNERTALAECKWKDRTNGEAILKELEKKSAHVPSKGGMEYFIFAKSFFRTAARKNAHFVDLSQLEDFFGRPPAR